MKRYRVAKKIEPYGYTGPQYKNLQEYISIKLNMLLNDFCLKLTEADVEYMRSLKTEADVDRCAHSWLMDRL